MCHQHVVQVVEDRPALQPPRLYHRQHPFHKTAPRLALAAEGVLPPQHPAPQHPLRVVVRRLDPLAHHEPPHRRQQRQHVRAEGRRLAVGAPPPRLESPLQGAAGRPTAVATPVGRSRPRGTGATPRTPARRHAATAAPAAPPPPPDRPTSGSPSSMHPAHLAAEGRQPVIALQRSLHTKPRTFSPSALPALPATMGVDQEGGHGVRRRHPQPAQRPGQLPTGFIDVHNRRFPDDWTASAWAGARASLAPSAGSPRPQGYTHVDASSVISSRPRMLSRSLPAR